MQSATDVNITEQKFLFPSRCELYYLSGVGVRFGPFRQFHGTISYSVVAQKTGKW